MKALNCLVCLFLLLAGSGLGAQEDYLGGTWLVLGPLPNTVEHGSCSGFDQDFLVAEGGEAVIKPQAGGRSASRVWQEVQGTGGRIDFLQIFGSEQDSLAYASRTFMVPAATTLALKVGSDDGIKIWLNGTLVLSNHVHRALTEYSETLLVDLKQGLNTLMVKVDQGSGDWKFSLALRTLAQEASAARTSPPRSFVLQMSSLFVAPGSQLQGLVSTNPSWLSREPVKLAVLDSLGQVLVQSEIQAGRSFALPLDPAWTGRVRLRVSGSLFGKELPPLEQELWLGDRKQVRTMVMVASRGRSLFLQDQADWKSSRALAAATWKFYGQQLSGALDQYLQGQLREDRAILAAAARLPGLLEPLDLARPGLWQYAYHSPLDKSVQPFSLYVPRDYDPGKTYGLVVNLHGYSGNDFDSARELARAEPSDFIILAPYGRGSIGYQGPGEQDVLDLMDLVGSELSIDKERIYLAGSSMGGHGTWRIGQFFADRFAAIAPFAGWTTTSYLANLLTVPTLIVHGDVDPTVSVGPDRQAAATLKALGATVRFDEIPGGGHNAWQLWIEDSSPDKLLAWFRNYRKNPWPDRFVLATTSARHGRRYWADLAELAMPGQLARLDIARNDERHLAVRTMNVASFDLYLDSPRLARGGRISLTVDGQAVTTDAAGQRVRFNKLRSGNWTAVDNTEKQSAGKPALARHDGGGIADLYYRPLTLVYGTKGASRGNLEAAARILSLGMGYRLVADVDLSQEIIDTNSLLILGNEKENTLTARLAKALPVAIQDNRAKVGGEIFDEAGVLQVCPNPLSPSHLVAVLSDASGGRAVKAFSEVLAPALMPYGTRDDTAGFVLPDILVFDDSLKALWSGSFDRDWKNPGPPGER